MFQQLFFDPRLEVGNRSVGVCHSRVKIPTCDHDLRRYKSHQLIVAVQAPKIHIKYACFSKNIFLNMKNPFGQIFASPVHQGTTLIAQTSSVAVDDIGAHFAFEVNCGPIGSACFIIRHRLIGFFQHTKFMNSILKSVIERAGLLIQSTG